MISHNICNVILSKINKNSLAYTIIIKNNNGINYSRIHQKWYCKYILSLIQLVHKERTERLE
jgi:hypothetical protein